MAMVLAGKQKISFRVAKEVRRNKHRICLQAMNSALIYIYI